MITLARNRWTLPGANFLEPAKNVSAAPVHQSPRDPNSQEHNFVGWHNLFSLNWLFVEPSLVPKNGLMVATN